MIGIIVIINIDIKDKLVIIIPLGIIVMLNAHRRSSMDDNRNVETERGGKRDDRIEGSFVVN